MLLAVRGPRAHGVLSAACTHTRSTHNNTLVCKSKSVSTHVAAVRFRALLWHAIFHHSLLKHALIPRCRLSSTSGSFLHKRADSPLPPPAANCLG